MGHFYDYHTKYNILFPLKQTDANYVADQLCQYCFSHFGLPRILYTNNSREFTDDLISAVMKQWSTDSVICSGNPNKKSSVEEMQSRQRTIMALLETMKAKDKVIGSKWPSLLPGIQCVLSWLIVDARHFLSDVFCQILQRRIQKPVKFLGWSVLRKYLTAKSR